MKNTNKRWIIAILAVVLIAGAAFAILKWPSANKESMIELFELSEKPTTVTLMAFNEERRMIQADITEEADLNRFWSAMGDTRIAFAEVMEEELEIDMDDLYHYQVYLIFTSEFGNSFSFFDVDASGNVYFGNERYTITGSRALITLIEETLDEVRAS